MLFTMHQRLPLWRSVSDWGAEQAGFALGAVLGAEQGNGSVSCAVPRLLLLSARP